MVYTDQGGKPEERIAFVSKTGRISKTGRTRRKRREAPFTERQLELLRARTTEHRNLKKMTWLGFCDAIFDHSQRRVWIKEDDLQQWATNFIAKRRKTPRHPNDEGFKALAAYLMDPDIGMILPEELNDPEPPYRFLHSFREFLGPNTGMSPFTETGMSRFTGKGLDGVYEACGEIEKQTKMKNAAAC